MKLFQNKISKTIAVVTLSLVFVLGSEALAVAAHTANISIDQVRVGLNTPNNHDFVFTIENDASSSNSLYKITINADATINIDLNTATCPTNWDLMTDESDSDTVVCFTDPDPSLGYVLDPGDTANVSFTALLPSPAADATYTWEVITKDNGFTSNSDTSAQTVMDVTKPTINSITTKDADGDGSTDTATIVFSEEVDDSTFSASNFSIAGVQASTINTGTADDDTFDIVLAAGVLGTEAKEVLYVAGSGADLVGNTMLSVASGDVVETDGANPVFLGAQTSSVTTIDLAFSEDLNGVTITNADFSVAGYVLDGANDAYEVSPGVARLTVTVPFGTGDTPNVTYSGSVTELALAGGKVAPAPVTETPTDGVAPTFTAETTSTTQITLTFSENVDSASDASSQWSVAGNTISSVTSLDGSGNSLVITLNTPINTYDTPNVTYTAGDVEDNSNNALVSTSETPSDGLAPLVAIDNLLTNDTTPALSGTVDDPTASVGLDVNGNYYVATNNGNGTWNLLDNTIAPALGEGVYDVAASSTDSSLNTSSDSSSNELEIDITAPNINITAPLAADEVKGDELITFTDDDVHNPQVSVDNTNWTNATSGVTTLDDIAEFAGLAEGVFTLYLRDIDTAGNTGSDSEVGIIKDTVAPTITIDNLQTNDNTPELTGAIDDNSASIQITVDGNDYVAANNGDGTWTLADDSTPALADGTYDVAAAATDTAGNVGNDASTDELKVDTLPPVITVNSLLTNDSTPELTGTVIDTTHTTIVVNVNGVDYAAADNDNGTWTLADGTIGALADGTYEVIATATDAFANVGVDASINELEIDTTAPVVTIDNKITNDNTPELTGTIDDTAASIQITVDGIDYAANNNGDGTWILADNTIFPGLLENTYDITVTATDAANNIGTDASADELVIDLTPPDVDLGADLFANAEVLVIPTIDATIAGPDTYLWQQTSGLGTVVFSNSAGAASTLKANNNTSYGVSLTVTDLAGNVAQDSFVFTWDTISPIVTVNNLQTNDNTPELTGTINDATAASIQVVVDGQTNMATNNGDGTWTLADDTLTDLTDGTYDVAATATDPAGNSGIDATSNELIVDATAPAFTINEGVDGVAVQSDIINISVVDAHVITETKYGFSIDNTCDVSDTYGNDFTSGVNFVITGNHVNDYLCLRSSDDYGNTGYELVGQLKVDNTDPAINLTGDNPQAVEVYNAYIEQGATASDNLDGDISGSIVIDDSAVDTNSLGSYNVTYTVSDAAGNGPVVETRVVNVVDTTKPVITLISSADLNVELGDAYVDAGATALDNYDGNITASIVIVNPVNTSIVGDYTVTYNVTDAHSNVATEVTRTVHVVDTTAPSITINEGATAGPVQNDIVNLSVSDLSSITTTDYGFSADNTCDISDVYGNNFSSGVNFTITGDYTNYLCARAIDQYNNTNYQLVGQLDTDNTKPVITLSGSSPIDVEYLDVYVDDGATALDNYDGDLTASIATVNPVNSSVLGVYTVTYNVSDSAGNVADEVTRTVNVVDTTKPVIILIGSADISLEVGSSYSDAGATALDNYDGDLTASINTVNPVDVNTVGDYIITYNVTDSNSNVAIEVTRTVHIVDTTKPVIAILGDNPQTIEVNTTYTEQGATSTDNYDGDLTASIVIDDSLLSTTTLGSYEVYYNVTDANSNAADTATRTVDVIDTTKPVITLTGSANISLTVGDTYSDDGATASDNYDGDLTASIVTVNPVDTNTAGTYTITYNVDDSSSNSADQVTRTVTVNNPAPVFTGGGGGGGSATVNDHTAPTETSININNGDETTNSIQVSLKLFAKDVYSMIISNYSDFRDGIVENYRDARQWILSDGEGEKTVYVKYKDQYGNESDTVSDSILYSQGEVLGEKIVNERETQLEQIEIDTQAVYPGILAAILANTGSVVNEAEHQTAYDNYTLKLIDGIEGLEQSGIDAITYFIYYGTASTEYLGAGERAGVINSYKAAFGKLPTDYDSWLDVIKIANGRWPSETSESAEAAAKVRFETIYLRAANMDNPNDNAAVTIMAYGLRPADRNLDSEKAAIKIFEAIFGYAPSSATDWDAVRAIAYSGAVR